MRILSGMVGLLLLAGCATTVAPSHVYDPEQNPETRLVIGARAVDGLVSDRITITINDEDVLRGRVWLWRLYDSLSGSYRGHQIEADCIARNDSIATLTRHYCTVFIDGRQVARLAF